MKPIFPWIRQFCRRRFRDLKLVWARRFGIRLRSGWDGINWLCSVLESNDWRGMKDCQRNWTEISWKHMRSLFLSCPSKLMLVYIQPLFLDRGELPSKIEDDDLVDLGYFETI
ncbi:hypothetical protein NPIL_40181 [Nephila pilipes]|uniref:Uncharacterized protein n=1 Tax=Nephila pilipes TaxID=299642 RepID=A0A8X6Q599_NEPPI|nr:hypothetical protein NPIL_40181 [Nephila pilipes]